MSGSVIRVFVLILVGSLASSCAPTNQSPGTTNEAKPNYTQLVDYLRRVPGLQITQMGDSYKIVVRGMGTLNADSEPLFVIDRTAVGTYDQAASMVDPNNIQYVNVLKDVASTSSYGMRGANGVIVIYTKR